MDIDHEVLNLPNSKKYEGISKLIELKKYDAAEAEINRILEKHPDDFSALLLKGICYEDKGRLGAAKKAYEDAIKKHPNDGRGHFFLGKLLAIQGLDKNEGVSELKKAITLNPSDADYKAALAQAYYYSNKNKEAKKLINKAIEEDPTNSAVKSAYAIIFNLSSKELIKELVKDNPNDDSVLNDLAVEYLEEGKYKMALETFEKALSINPNNTLYHNNYLIAKKANWWFYRPKHILNQFLVKHGMFKFYAIWFASLILAVFIFQPLVLFFILFAIYTWVADPIADSVIRI